jgi:hypothetical protein
VVTCVQTVEIVDFAGSQDRGEVTDWLGRMRADGKLICQRGPHGVVRLSSGEKVPMHVFRGER